MSTTATTTRTAQFSHNNQNKNTFKDHVEDQNPIKRYMRQNNFHQLLQDQAAKKDNTKKQLTDHNMGKTVEFQNLKQFQKSLQKQQAPNKQTVQKSNNQKIVSLQKTPQKRLYQSYILINKNMQDIAIEYQAQKTQKYGEQIMRKIKNFIVQEDSPGKKSPIRRKIQSAPYVVSSSVQKLHNDHKRREIIRREQYAQKAFHQDLKQYKQFKVTNPTSVYLIQRKMQKQRQQKPFYERSIQMARQKQQTVLQRHLQKEQQEYLRQQEQLKRYQAIRQQKHQYWQKKEGNQKFQLTLAMKQKILNQAKQHEKLKYFKQITKRKPYVSKVSKEIFTKVIEREELSRQFLERNMEYRAERQKEKINEIKQHDKQYCPFAPKISQSSRELAEKYYQRKQNQELLNKLTEMQVKQKKQQSAKKTAKISAASQLNSSLRCTSAHVVKNKSVPSKEKPKIKEQDRKCIQKYQLSDIPVYNLISHKRARTTSLYNLALKK